VLHWVTLKEAHFGGVLKVLEVVVAEVVVVVWVSFQSGTLQRGKIKKISFKGKKKFTKRCQYIITSVVRRVRRSSLMQCMKLKQRSLSFRTIMCVMQKKKMECIQAQHYWEVL
jgi:hypothetical protein